MANFMVKVFKNIKFITIFWVLFYFLIFSLLLRGGFGYLDPDLGWHLRVGEQISESFKVPSQNLYNYTYTGNWVDHEWLSNYLIFEIYNNLGYPALVVFFALIIIFVLILLNLSITYLWRLKGKEPPSILLILFQLVGVVASLPHFGVRIQEFALLFLFLVLLIIYFYNKNKKWTNLLWLIPLFYFWSSLHASFLIGLFIVFAWAGVKLFEKMILDSRFKERLLRYIDFGNVLRYKQIVIYILISISAVLSTLFTPYYWKLYAFLGGYGNTFYLSYINEWLSQFTFPFYYWQLFYLSLAGLAFFIYVYYAKKKKIDIWTSFIFLLFFILSFKSRRHLPLFFVSTFIFLIYIYSDYIEVKMSQIGKMALWLKVYLIFCLFLTCASILFSINYVKDPFYSSAFNKDYPVKAINFINEKYGNNVRIFNNYGWGGYMIYRNPERKIFIDGRLPQVSYKGHSYLEEYLEFYKSDYEIARKLEEYSIDIVLIRTTDPEVKAKKWEKIIFSINDEELKSKNSLRDYLNKNSDWQKAYSDKTATVYTRK